MKKKNKEVLKLEYQDVFDKVAVRIVYQDEKVMPRGIFEDDELGIQSMYEIGYHHIGGVCIRGTNKDADDEFIAVSKEEAVKIQEKVLKLNQKYGKIKSDEEIIASYPSISFESNRDSYFLVRDRNGNYYGTFFTFGTKIIGVKYYSSGTLEKMVKELNDKNKESGYHLWLE